MILKIVPFFLLIFLNFQISAQTMYAIIVANTEDAQIGQSCEIDQMMMIAEMNTISKTIGYDIVIKTFKNVNFNFESLEQYIKNLHCQADDIIYFYYTGHGFNESHHGNKYPVMALKTGYYPMQILHEQLKQKGAKLCITMGDCCNDVQDIISRAKTFQKNLDVVEDDTDNKIKIYQNLFLHPKGDIIVSSSKRGECSYVHRDKGSYFTDEFRKALVYAVNYSKDLSWETLLTETKNRVLRINSEKVQTAQFDINLNNTPNPPQPHQPEYTDINKYLNDLADENISKSKRSQLLDNYQKYFQKNARVDIFVGKTRTDLKIVEDFLDRLYLHANKIKSINLIENKSNLSSNGKKYEQISVQEIW